MTYKFKEGDRGKTRDGNDYRIVFVRTGAPLGVYAAVQFEKGETLQTFTSDGKFLMNSGDLPQDLLPPTKTVYLSVWYSKDGRIHSSLFATKELEATARTEVDEIKIVSCQPVELQADFIF